MMGGTLPPVDDVTTIAQLDVDPYPIYTRMRAETPIVRVASVKRIFVTKAAECRAVKDDPVTFSSDDPNTPMKPAFEAHTLMRKDGAEHKRERDAMMPAFGPKPIMQVWQPLYRQIAEEYLDRLPKDGIVDLHRDHPQDQGQTKQDHEIREQRFNYHAFSPSA